MKFRRTIVQETMLFVAVVAALLSTAAFVVSTQVTRTGLEDLYRQRMDRAKQVLDQYSRVNALARVSELEAVLKAPRFLAALETYDPLTVAHEIGTHGVLADANLVILLDSGHDVLYASEDAPARVIVESVRSASRLPGPIDLTYLTTDGHVCELVVADVTANNGQGLGRLVLGTDLNDLYASDLRRLTGFDIVLSLDGEMVGTSGTDVGKRWKAFEGLRTGEISRIGAGRDEILAMLVQDPVSGLSVTFVGSVGDQIAPIMSRILGLLVPLAVLGSLAAMLLVYVFTSRRVGRQVSELVSSAERIAEGDLGFEIVPRSKDELGYLASEFEKMRSRLVRGRDELERAHEARLGSERMATLGQMATGIVHDFKNPMAVVLGTADLIAHRGQSDPKLVKQCGVIRTQVERMAALTRDVLEYASGRSQLEVEVVDLAAYLAEIADAHREPCERAGVQLFLADACGFRVRIDPDRMRRVLDNLLNNAREFSRVGDRITIRCAPEPGAGTRLEVEDEGPGIPPERLESIFEPFVTHGKKGGSGLGLAISRKIARDHGADLGAENLPDGRGARFVVRLPEKLLVTSPTPAMEVDSK